MIINNYNQNTDYFTNFRLNETINFRNFKVAGKEGFLACQIRSIIVTLLADCIVREANHFIRILESMNV